ncbi:MAG: response regulator [Anaerolineae bacterium]|nr:response regulator [Anaerolineae bacterium]
MMSAKQEVSEPAALPEEFIEQVKDALEHLYDFPYLQRHPLGPGESETGNSTKLPGQQLREELIAAIESLSPETGVPFRSPQARLYNLIRLRYVEAMTVQETAHELGISLRQAYRDLRRGEESLSAILWTRRAKSPPQLRATQLSSIEAEMERLDTRPRPTDIRLLIQHAQKAVEQLALQRAIDFQTEVPPEPVIVSTDPVMARQVLVNMFSHTIQQAQPGTLQLRLTADEKETSLSLRYRRESKANSQIAANHVVIQLTERLGWKVRQKDQAESIRIVTLQMMVCGPTILVIDDNAGLVELLDRYLTGHTCRVVAAASGQEGLQLAQEIMPDAIVLDVMMPEMDGWELLQRLRSHRQIAKTPVIICSVFNDPELAYSLGASLFLPKPVRRDDVLAALRQVGVV